MKHTTAIILTLALASFSSAASAGSPDHTAQTQTKSNVATPAITGTAQPAISGYAKTQTENPSASDPCNGQRSNDPNYDDLPCTNRSR